jgi:excisionase family DNA binding protein
MNFRHPDQLLLPWSPRVTVSTSRVAEILNCSDNTVVRLIEDGSLKAYKLRGASSPWRINYDSLMAYIGRIHDQNSLETRF